MNQVIYTEQTYTIGSTEIFQLRAYKNGLLWDLTGGTVLFKIAKPDQTIIVISAFTIYNGGAMAGWTVIGPVSSLTSQWFCCWDVTDMNGVRQVSMPIKINVESSPI